MTFKFSFLIMEYISEISLQSKSKNKKLIKIYLNF